MEDWNVDQMALRGLRGLRPGTFKKPPFHTYINHLFVIIPVQATEMVVQQIKGTKQKWNHIRLIGSRLLVMVLHLGTIALGYLISLRFFGKFAARVIAFFLGTFAGFIAYAHFLTCDSPLLFFLVAALYFAQRIVQRGETRDYFWAGLLAGLATATKYNGLGAAILIPVAHLLSNNCTSLRACLFQRRLFIGLAMIPAGFLIGNPYAIIDSKRFVADFMYNYEVTPAYGGASGHGYGVFLRQFPEIVGWPGAIALGLLALASLVIVLVPRLRSRETVSGYLLGLSFFLLYYLKMGEPARVPTRFVLPAIPFFVMLAGPSLAAMQSRRLWICALLAPVICYNTFCAALVGQRFASDPRLAAQIWMIEHVPPGRVIESSDGSPHWTLLSELHAVELKAADPKWNKVHPGQSVDLRMPAVNGRFELFGRIFKGNRWVEAGRRQEGQPDEQLFTRAALARRNPDFITVYSRDTTVPSKAAQSYYTQLLANAPPYVVRFNRHSAPVSRFVYPKEIDFLEGGIAILERQPGLPVK
ncbi:MAG: glycosyltransferase family 39 protein [Chthoniobacterales bacterium]|nr:glycosyltransferase family 39 protein [Chthoniobacterales bacterium]